MSPTLLALALFAAFIAGAVLVRLDLLERLRNYVWWQLMFEPITSKPKALTLICLFVLVHPARALQAVRRVAGGA